MKKLVAVAVLTTSIFATTACTQTTTAIPENHKPTTITHTVCEEDMPCWDCHTMGNKVCGPFAEYVVPPITEITSTPAPIVEEAPVIPEVAPEVTTEPAAPTTEIDNTYNDAINTMMDGKPYDSKTMSDFDSTYAFSQFGEPKNLKEGFEAFESLTIPNLYHVFNLG